MGNGITMPSLNSNVASQELLLQIDKEIDYIIRTNPELKTEVEAYKFSQLNQLYDRRDMSIIQNNNFNLPKSSSKQRATINLSQTNDEKTVIDIYNPPLENKNNSSNIANHEDKNIFLYIMRLKGFRPMTSLEFFEKNYSNNIQGNQGRYNKLWIRFQECQLQDDQIETEIDDGNILDDKTAKALANKIKGASYRLDQVRLNQIRNREVPTTNDNIIDDFEMNCDGNIPDGIFFRSRIPLSNQSIKTSKRIEQEQEIKTLIDNVIEDYDSSSEENKVQEPYLNINQQKRNWADFNDS